MYSMMMPMAPAAAAVVPATNHPVLPLLTRHSRGCLRASTGPCSSGYLHTAAFAPVLAAGGALLAAGRRRHAVRIRNRRTSQISCSAGADSEEPMGSDDAETPLGQGGSSGSKSSSSSSSTAGPKVSQQLAAANAKASSLDVLLPTSSEMVNADVPNHFMEIYRNRRSKSVMGGPSHVYGRSKKSKQKVEYRLKQGPALAHDNWDFPSRLRVSTGIAKRRRLEQPRVNVRPTMERVREAMFNQVTAMHLFDDRSVRVLDLYSGTGSIGIEALSRGAAECVFVDSAKECVNCSIANAWLAGFIDQEEAAKGPMNERSQAETGPLMMVGGPRAQVQIELHKAQVARQPVGAVQADVLDLLEDPEKYGLVNRSFNLIVVSPPYNEVSYRRLCTALAKSELLERDGLLCIEYPRELGVLPPILCAPFEDPEDMDDIASGIPMLHGLRNREYGSTMLAIYSKLPTGARGTAGEPRPWEFTETLMQDKLIRRSRDLWRTPSLFQDHGERAFAVPEKDPALEE
ncbi:unnamed protein product [Polarella glacialis]|uniref:Uncharacterized protein n=1 Tax=Polarella glacialis TaxID=89957 RepID=A0A813G3Y1_POLGL|nr:unnamed protein product [Polarella glacialis]|mmetsp:Transcript_23471/g.37769  ORF Transcript_23471/g.37769 Transcript_23471/m.37769 type:complete len:516 (-) Transcript_23471:70-1617(-)